MMTKGAKKFRSVMCGIISFLLCVSLTLLCLLGCIRLTALNKGYAVRILERSGYADSLHKELKEHFISYGSACNIDESFFDGIFESLITPQLITEYTVDSLSGFYGGLDASSDAVDKIEKGCLEALKVYADEKGYVVEGELVDNLEVMSAEMGELFTSYAGLFTSSYFNSAASMLERYLPLLNWAMIGLAVFSLLAIIVIRLFFAKAKNYLRYYIYSTAGSALMLGAAPAAALIMKIGSKINVANASLYGFASGFMNNIFVALLISAAVMAAVTALLAVIRSAAIKKNQ